MNILIDTHILVCREYDRTIERHLQEVIRLINDLNYRLVVHRLSVTEIEKDNNIPNKNILLSKIRTYSSLDSQSNPYDDANFFKLVQKPENERDKVDSYLLYCLYKKEVDLFLTEDEDIIEKAAVLNISGKVMNLKDASSFLRALKEKKTKGSEEPVYCFYKKGQKWLIGEKGKESYFKESKGLEFIHYLLCFEDKRQSSIIVYNLGKVSGDEALHEKISKRERVELGMHIQAPVYNKSLSAKERKIIESEINNLKDEIESEGILSPEDKMNKEEEIEKLNKVLNKKPERDYKSQTELARINVTKRIKEALKKISKDKTISSVSRYLNNGTIKTGDNCVYCPNVNDKPSWILYPESNNQ